MPHDLCFLFPGQSSWRSNMLRRALASSPESQHLVDIACQVLGRDLLALDEHLTPSSNRDVQVAVVVASLIHLAALDAAGVRAGVSLGLSLGEYVHLAHIGALDLADLLRLVDARGAAYDAGPSGKMVAIFPMAHDELVAVLDEHGEGRVEIANVNSPTQHVIAGEHAAVDRVVLALDRDHVVEARTIEERIPMHTSRFAPVAEAFRVHLERASFRAPRLAYHPNLTAQPIATPTSGDFVHSLSQHVHRPVLWRASIETRIAERPDVTFIEVGPGRVLTNLLQRRWVPNRKLATDSKESLRAGIDAIKETLHG